MKNLRSEKDLFFMEEVFGGGELFYDFEKFLEFFF